MKWYVLQVKTGEEIAVRDKLLEKGYIACTPQEERPIRKGGSWEYKLYTLFNGYVFIECNFDAKTYYEIKEVPCVIKWLGTHPASPSPLSYMEIEWIVVLAQNGLALVASKVKVLEDDTTEIQDGILKNFEHCIKKIDKHARRATVELTVAGEIETIQLAIEIVE